MNLQRVALVLFTLALPAGLTAQQEASDTAAGETTSAAADILAALELPTAAEILRERGVPVEEIEAAIESARERAVSPGEMTGVLEETAESVEENGPIENFGAFVQERLAEGLRGRELAEAIRAEHARRGIGQGRMLESRRGPPEGRGRGMRGARPDSVGGPGMDPDSMGGPGMRGRRGGPPDSVRGGRPDSAGPPAGRGGRPDSAGGGGERGNRANNGSGGQ